MAVVGRRGIAFDRRKRYTKSCRCFGAIRDIWWFGREFASPDGGRKGQRRLSGERRLNAKTVAVASDHAGFALKSDLADDLRTLGHRVLDLGPASAEPVDYPDFGHALARAVASGEAEIGVAVCGSGIGIGMALNRHPGVRAAVCHDSLSARLSRQHNNANVLALGGRLIGVETARDALRTFLETPFDGGRHVARVDKIDSGAP